MKHVLGIRQMVLLASVVLFLTACGGDTDGASDNRTETLAVITPTPISSDASSQTPDVSTHASADEDAALVSERPPTTKEPGDDPDAPWGKDLPVGSAPTAPPAPPSDFDADGDGFYTFDDLERAVNHLFPSYEWPENYQVTPEHMLSGFAPMAEQGARWQVQYEYTLVGLYHVCAWEHAWLDAFREGNTESMDESVYQLLNVAVANPVFIHLRDGIEERTNRALLGDPALIQRHVDNSCASYEFLPPN